MEQNADISIQGKYQCMVAGKELFVLHTCFSNRFYNRHFLYVHCEAITACVAKEIYGNGFLWTGNAELEVIGVTGGALEQACGIQLPSQPCFNPFARASYPAACIEHFEVEGMQIEKAPAVYAEVEACYYRAQNGSEQAPVVCCYRLPLNQHWDWRPVSYMHPSEFDMMHTLIAAWETGEYMESMRISDAIARVLKGDL